MKKKIFLFLMTACALNVRADYDPIRWEVDDSTTNVEAISGLIPSNGFNQSVMIPHITTGYSDTYTYEWQDDVIKIDFVNTQHPNNWSDFGFKTAYYKGETGNAFYKDSTGQIIDHDPFYGYTVDFTQEENRTVSFMYQVDKDVNINANLQDIGGKLSNGSYMDNVLLKAHATGVDLNDNSKWQTVSFSWGADPTTDAYVSDAVDLYSQKWWNNYANITDFTPIPLDLSKIIGVLFTFDNGSTGMLNENKQIYIKDLQIGNTNPVEFTIKGAIKLSTKNIAFESTPVQASVNVECTQAWNVATSATWLHIDSPQNIGDKTITITADVNTLAYREATVLIMSEGEITETIFVSQMPETTQLSVVNADYLFSSDNIIPQTLEIVSNTKWTVVSNEDWIKIFTNTGLGNSEIQLGVLPNKTIGQRTGTVTISGLGVENVEVTITQEVTNQNPTDSKWTVNDKTENVYSITGLVPSNGYGDQYIYNGYGDQYNYKWNNNVLEIDFTNTLAPSNWSSFDFSTVQWVGETHNRFMYDSTGIVQAHDFAKGQSVNFAEPENRIVSFKYQASSAMNLSANVTDIHGKNSNGYQPMADINPVVGGIDANDESKWQEFVFSWGDDALADASVSEMVDKYSGVWWDVIANINGESYELDANHIINFSLIIDQGQKGNIGDEKTLIIKDLVIGAAQNPVDFKSSKKLVLSSTSETLSCNKTETTISIDSDTLWTASSSNNWITINKNTGVKIDELTISCDANYFESRVGNVLLENASGVSTQIQIVQSTCSPQLELDKPIHSLNDNNYQKSIFNLTSTTAWTIKPNQDWLSVSPKSGVGNAEVTITAHRNSNTESRDALLVISAFELDNKLVQVIQEPSEFNATQIWEVDDKTTHVNAITNLSPYYGYPVELINPLYGDIFGLVWIDDVLQIDMTNTLSPSNWSSVKYDLATWTQNSNNYFVYDTAGVYQDHNIATGYTVDFTNPENRVMTFKYQANKEAEFKVLLSDIAGRSSNETQELHTLTATNGGVDISDDAKWQTVTLSWGNTNADIMYNQMLDLYSGYWNNRSLTYLDNNIDKHLDSSRIAGFELVFDPGAVGTYGDEKQFYIKDIVFGASTEILYYKDIVEPQVLETNTQFISLIADGTQDYILNIESNVEWIVTASQAWVHFSKTSGASSSEIRVSASVNNSAQRDAYITLSSPEMANDIVILVTQKEASSINVTVTAGALSSQFTAEELLTITSLQLEGEMDVRDFYFIRDNMPNLETLILTNISIVAFEGEIDDALLKANVKYNGNTIPSSAFKHMVSLRSIALPQSIVEIEEQAFYGCSMLDNINISADPTQIVVATNTFDGVDKLRCNIIVPYTNVGAYQSANVWNEFSNVKSAVGITTVDYDNTIVVMPNPASEYIVVSCDDEVLALLITDLQGRILVKSTSHFNKKISISHLVSGVYNVTLTTTNGIVSKQFIKK